MASRAAPPLRRLSCSPAILGDAEVASCAQRERFVTFFAFNGTKVVIVIVLASQGNRDGGGAC